MMGEAELAQYRRMSPAQRVAEHQLIMRGVWKLWEGLASEEIQRRLDAAAVLQDRSNEAMLRELSRRDRI